MKGCPWCGEQPICWYNPTAKRWFAGCDNSACPVDSEVVANTEDEAIKIWDRRHDFEDVVKLMEGRG